MAPRLAREPFHRDGWVYEEKVDGWRMLAHKDGERVRLLSRNGCDHHGRFADVAAAIAKLPARTLALDGEHRRCGDLDGDVEGESVWMACSCGVCSGARRGIRLDSQHTSSWRCPCD
jgi:hypothetical protein